MYKVAFIHAVLQFHQKQCYPELCLQLKIGDTGLAKFCLSNMNSSQCLKDLI